MAGTVVGVRAGKLWVEASAAGPCGPAVLGFAGGGRVAVDPVDPSRLLWLEVDDPEDALPVLQTLLGEQAAGVLVGPDPVGREVDVVPGPGAAAWARWALATWYDTWTPLTVAHPLAMADVGLAAAETGAVRAAFEALDVAAPALLAVAGKAADRAVPPVLQERLVQALQTAGEVLGPVHPAAAGLVRMREVLTARESAVLEAVALTLGGAHQVSHLQDEGEGGALSGWSVDWSLVPPRVLATDEDTVKVTTDADGGVQIEVDRHPLLDPDSAAARWLLVRLVDPADAIPVVAVPLSWNAADGQFAAFVPADRLGGRNPADLTVDVCRAETLDRVRLGAAAAVERGRRDSIRSLTQARLATAAHVLGDDGQADGLLERAAHHAGWAHALFAQANSDDPTAAHTGLVAAAEAWADRLDLPDPDVPDPGAGDGPGRALLSELVLAWDPAAAAMATPGS